VSSASRRAEFFALEATEYLSELEPLVSRADPPDLERLVRGARALRGAALMAGLGTFARAAAGLEAVARQVRDHAIAWDGPALAGWREAVGTLRSLVARATSWEAGDDRQALALAERLERVAAGRAEMVEVPQQPTPQPPPATKGSLTPGVRAFIARESELIASSLLEAAHALAPLPPAAALTAVLERMRSLRGLGAAGDLSPLPELLEAMEATTRSLLSDSAPPPNVAEVFADAADALHEMARTVAQEGRVLVPEGLDKVATRLLQAFASESDVVAIESLGFTSEPVMVSRGESRHEKPADPVPIELVGMGDYLLVQADELEHQGSPTARDLRLFVLQRTLDTMPTDSGTGRFLAPLIRAILGAITSGVATTTPDRFARALRSTGEFLGGAATRNDVDALAYERDTLAREFGAAIAPRISAPVEAQDAVVDINALAPDEDEESDETDVVEITSLAPEPVEELEVVDIESLAPSDEDVVDIESLAPSDEGVVDIESLAPDPVADEIVDINSLAPDDHVDGEVVEIESLAPDPGADEVVDFAAPAPGTAADRLQRAYRRRAELIREQGLAEPSLAGLAGGETVVPVETLLYRGQRALHRAEELRSQIAMVLSEPTVSLDRLRPLVDELLDLVPLARDAA
jgi:chemotaxis protein histidine kinase CheA